MMQLAVRTRSGRVESIHSGYICITDANNKLVHSIGNHEASIFLRSSGKPFYAIALAQSGALEKYNISQKEFAIACSSHNAQAFHRRLILSILKKLGLNKRALDCGSTLPESQEVSDALIMLGKKPEPIFNNCSGKHVALLALCRYYNYDIQDYTNEDHPVNQRIKKLMAELLVVDETEIITGRDGCTLPTYLLTIRQAAWLYARLARGDSSGDRFGEEFGLIQQAMIQYPRVIRGDDTFCTDLISLSKGRALGKIGAEGIYCIAIPEKQLGVCIKIFDGHPWSSYPVAVRILEDLEILDSTTVKKLDKWALPQIKDDKGEIVGYIHPSFSLTEGISRKYELGDVY